MGQTTEQIARRIDTQRQILASNLHDLETRVKRAFDWRHQLKTHPRALTFVAIGGGLLLISLLKRVGRSDRS